MKFECHLCKRDFEEEYSKITRHSINKTVTVFICSECEFNPVRLGKNDRSN